MQFLLWQVNAIKVVGMPSQPMRLPHAVERRGTATRISRFSSLTTSDLQKCEKVPGFDFLTM
jgi:hypothetical protein